MPGDCDEWLRRFGLDPESIAKLEEQASMAEQILGIHGVSVTARESSNPARFQWRSIVEQEFRVHDTPSRRDRLHRTVELPKPVTLEVVERFHRLFGSSSS